MSTIQSRRLRAAGTLRALVALVLGRRQQPLQPRGAGRGGRAARGDGAHARLRLRRPRQPPTATFGCIALDHRRGAKWPACRCARRRRRESAGMPSTHLATFDGLVKRYGDTTAVEGLSLAVPEGTVCGLLGPNGAGKTTAIRVLLGLAKPSAGIDDAARRVARQPGLRRRGAPGRHAHRAARHLRPRDAAPEHADRGVGAPAARRRPPDRRAARARRALGARRHALGRVLARA